MKFLKKHCILIAITISAATIGAWIQYTYSNGHHVIFDVFDNILILINKYLDLLVASLVALIS